MTDKDFEVNVIGVQVWDPASDNLDVEVKLADGRRFGATYFTLQNIQRLFEKNRSTGECLNGLYLWASNMILVEHLTLDTIRSSVRDLLDSGEFFSAFARFDAP
jgi:hypothetical protein